MMRISVISLFIKNSWIIGFLGYEEYLPDAVNKFKIQTRLQNYIIIQILENQRNWQIISLNIDWCIDNYNIYLIILFKIIDSPP